MGGDEDALAGEHLRADLILEERPGAGDGVLQALGVGELVGSDVAVLLLGVRVALVAGLKLGRADVEGATPDENLLVTVLGGGIGLVQALQGAVVALVELPALDDGQPLAVHLLEHEVKSVDGALQAGGVADVEVEAGLLEGTAAGGSLLLASLGQLDVGPAGEQVELVPLGLAVTDKDELHRVFCHASPPRIYANIACDLRSPTT